MIYYKTPEEIELIRKSSLLVGKTHAELAGLLRPGITGLELDRIAETFIRDHGGVPSFKNYNGYPFTLCISVNSMVVHGFPSSEPFKEGDIVSLDCGVYMNGFHGDSAYTFCIGEVPEQTQKLLRVTRESLMKGVAMAVAGNRLGDISYAVQHHAESNGFSVVRELVGHGLGRNLHESPEVPNYGKRGNGIALKEGLVIAIEPMINQGKREVKTLKDGWTVVTRDGLPSAHFEHTVAVGKNGPDVLSTFEYIEEAIKKNNNLTLN
jgi:methionyl aminopeptidase